ncbi:hypothetical protein L6164_017164 [Bauhinia variegata]|uniref:Uncharacterized protein n=1 Tax=Bauhinia variegata TaxID=167791 RepID=A0ACB9NC12_BAUVA|nr:hypothetical protein L6164_017164 [Bauhinia variegata]
MAEVGISIAAKVAEYLVQPVICQGQYLFCANKFLKNLENNKKKLMSTRDIVLKRVEEAKRKTERIEDVVQKWLTEVQTLLEEVEKLEQQVKANDNCFQGRCPTRRRYHLCKEMVKKTKVMIEFDNESNFKTFARLATLPGIEYSSSEGFTFFESTKLAYAQLWEALQDDGVYRIALFGLGGSGKTTLVTEVGKKAKESNLFDRVVEVTVSQTPNVRNIQGQMADMLNFKLEEETEKGRAQRLHMRLKGEKRILIIVDDVWGEFNLKDIGIDFDLCHSGSCKIILTTRCQQICTLMDCQKKIQLDLLNEDEAWALFKRHAEPDNQSSFSLSSVAQDIARECKGLPVAIQAVGRSLKGQSIHEWKIALEKLRSSKPVDVEDGQGDVFSCLKLSYDYLKDENKLLFLICCIFPEDYDISNEDLIRCVVGLGVYGEYQSFDLVRSQIMVGINKLVESCLLMRCERWCGRILKMHDLVRDLGLWIASKEGSTIMVNLSNDLNSLIGDEVINDQFAWSSWYRRTNQTSTLFVAAKLEILWIETGVSLDLSSESFDGLQGLKVMVLNTKDGNYLSLPPSIESLTNLRTLCLRGWNLGDISFVVKLKKLEVLELRSCIFNELPNEIGNLNKLKLLDLCYCDVLSENYEAIGELSKIEELYLFGASYSGERWRNQTPSFVDNVAASKLQGYVIKFAETPYFYSGVITEDSIRRALYLKSINISSLSASIKNLLQKAEYIDFDGNCQNFVPHVVKAVGGMKDLVVLRITSCLEMECVVDTMSNQVDVELPALVGLHLSDMTNLKEVCHGPPPVGFFEKLQELYVRDCEQLHSIFPRECKLPKLKILSIKGCRAAVLFSVSVAQSLSQLEELIITNFGELKHIITEEEDGGDTNTGKEIVPASHNSHLILPNLKRLSVRFCHKLESICPISCIEGLEKLEEIELVNDSRLTYVFGQYDQRDHSSHQKNGQIVPASNNSHLILPNLKALTLQNLDNFRGICPEKYHPSCPSLKKLRVLNCTNLTVLGILIGMETELLHLEEVSLEESQQKHLIVKLEELHLDNCPKLKSIWTVPTPKQSFSLHYVRELNVTKCDKLKCLFPIIVSKSLPELTSLKVDNCEDLEEIMDANIEDKNLSDAQVCFPKLKLIQISFCRKLKSLLPVACVFSRISEEGTSNGHEIVIPNLEELKFIKLPSFVGISPGFKLHAVNLVKMIVDECPIFAPIIDTTQVVPQPCTQIGLHASANSQKISEEQEKNVIWSVKWMYLKQLQYLKYVPTSVSLKNLICLRVSGCRKLKTVFCAGVIRSICLPQLKYLYVENCEELKEIIINQAQEGSSTYISMAHSQHVYLPKLVYLSIWRCSKLKSVFSISMVKHLPELWHMEIIECSQLEQVFCCSSEDNGGVVMKVNLLPKLERLVLRGLPSLTHVFRDSNQLEFPAMQHFTVEECSNFSPESFQLPLQGYYSSVIYDEIRWQVSEALYEEFLCSNYDFEIEKVAGKNKRDIVGKSKFYLYLQREPLIPYFERFSPTPITKYGGFGHNLDADLFIKGTKIWDEAKVRKLYTKEAADIILRNHLPESSKSCAYIIYLNNFVYDSYLFDIHKKLENATLLQRHKFLWRDVLHSTLPVQSQLKRIFKSEKYSTCFLCSDALETVDHLFLQCSFVRSLWFTSPWGFRIDHCSGLRMPLWFNFLTNHSKELLLYASVMMDKVWDERNRIAHASNSNPPDILSVAKSILMTYFEMKNKLLPDMQELVDVINIMCPDGWFKAYFDVAMTEEESWAAALLLNHEGNLIGARTRKLSTKFLLEQEALALELAVELACDVVPKSNICLLGDRERVIRLLQDYLNDEMDKEVWYLEPILMDVRDKLGSMCDWDVKKIFRNFNWLAYNAAKWAASCNSEGDVLNSVPAIEVLSKMDFESSFCTNDDDENVPDSLLNNSDNEDDDDEYVHDSLLNNSDNEDDDDEYGHYNLLNNSDNEDDDDLEAFTHDDGNNDDKKINEDGNNGNA